MKQLNNPVHAAAILAACGAWVQAVQDEQCPDQAEIDLSNAIVAATNMPGIEVDELTRDDDHEVSFICRDTDYEAIVIVDLSTQIVKVAVSI